MHNAAFPQGYVSLLTVYETQKAIGLLKRMFEDALSGALCLRRVSGQLRAERRSERGGAPCIV